MLVLVVGGLSLLVFSLLLCCVPLWRQQDKRSALALAVMIPLVAAVGYGYWGAGGETLAWLSQGQQRHTLRQEFAALGSPEDIIQQLRVTIARDDSNPQGWYLLGKMYLQQQQFGAAKDALAKADALQPNNPEVLFGYAQALFFSANEADLQHADEVVQQLLQLQPDNQKARQLAEVISEVKQRMAIDAT